ncbi:snapalysin family zinc-dependent metalloprotease [Streptomyces sp. G-5]|uniref:snapalysin family zinc-dependent metalloprotease n=1 Tax=Streptomyces TaxID=1883 RepID=UPI0021D2B3FA|nr:snapalysin family zinc-dependent metalloprotease [Streptomyces sp. G-5]MCU4745994.1 snapalysin family zinc-dependent metalloprotease [Streptomyces sp. G-5]
MSFRSFRTTARALVTGLVSALVLTTGVATAAPAAPAEEPTAAARVLTYDASGSAEFASAVTAGVAVWNESVTNVRLTPAAAGQSANIRIIADNGWPRALRTSLGNGIVYMGREAVGYNTTRIAAHELGHILGLPDIKPGPCSSLMSGSTAGTSCTNPYPNTAEKAAVENYFAGSLAATGQLPGRQLFMD